MVFPQLDPGSTVLVDPGKTLYQKEADKRRGVPMVKVGGSQQQKFLVLRFFDVKEQQGIDRYRFLSSSIVRVYDKVLQGDEFEVEPQEGHTFEVKPHGNVDHVVASQEYREDSNEAALQLLQGWRRLAQASLTFNNTVACEVISKWKAGLKDDMDARSDVYVLSNGCKKCSDDSDVYYWEIHNEKLVQTLLKGHSILSLEGSLSGDCDVKKNDRAYKVLWILTTPWGSNQSQAAFLTLTGLRKKEQSLKGHFSRVRI
ncbi:hypothetical protein Tco_0510882 [Tanacetum coccineum]